MFDNEYIRIVQSEGKWHMLLADYYDDRSNIEAVTTATPFKANVPRNEVLEWCRERNPGVMIF